MSASDRLHAAFLRQLVAVSSRIPSLPAAMPGTRRCPASWFAHRLGLLDSRGALVDTPDGVAALDAVRFFVMEVLDCDELSDPLPPSGPSDRWARDWGWKPKEADWGWVAPKRPGEAIVKGRTVPRSGWPLKLREALALLWRARLHHILGLGLQEVAPIGSRALRDLAEHLFRKVTAHDADPALVRLVLGADDVGAPLARPISTADLELPNNEAWWWLSSGVDGVRCVVADLDCKQARDKDHLRARIQMLCSGIPGIPRPHLVVTSKGGMGRHAYWFLYGRLSQAYAARIAQPELAARDGQPEVAARDGQPKVAARPGKPKVAARAAQPEIPARDRDSVALRFRERLRLLGMVVEDGAVEIFPKGLTPGIGFTALPFGPRSWLCDEDGWEIVARDPIESLVRWRSRFTDRLPRLSADDFTHVASANVPASLMAIVREKPPSRRHGEDENETVSPVTRDSAPAAPAERGRQVRAPVNAVQAAMTLAEAREVLARGAVARSSNDDMKTVARLLRYHMGRPGRSDPNTDDERDFLGWLRDHGDGSRQSWLTRFRFLFRSALPFATASVSPRLLSGDIRWAAGIAMERLPGQKRLWPDRKRLMIALLVIAARARAVTGVAGWSESVVVCSEDIEDRWIKEGFATCCALLTRPPEVMRLSREHEPPRRVGPRLLPGRCAEYEVELPPPVGVVWPVPDLDSLLVAIASAINATTGSRLAITARAWRDFARTAHGRQPSDDHPEMPNP